MLQAPARCIYFEHFICYLVGNLVSSSPTLCLLLLPGERSLTLISLTKANVAQNSLDISLEDFCCVYVFEMLVNHFAFYSI